MKIRFDGRVVVITGAAGALGTAYALAFAERGARLVVNDLGSDKDGTGISGAAAERLAERVRGSGGEALATMDDVGTRDGAARLIARTIESYGRIDVLVNNAGIMRDRAFKKMDMDDFDEVVRVNLAGCAYVSRSALPHMIEQQFGRILMVTSAAGLYGVFGAANYVAAKMGVVGLTRALHIEGIRHNIHVNAVAPVAASRLLDGFVSGLAGAEALSPAYVAPLVLYLCSEGVQPSGQIFEAGGGYYSRVAVVEGSGWRADPGEVPSPEHIDARIDDISDMTGARAFSDGLEAVRHVLGEV